MATSAKAVFPRITKPTTKIKLISEYEKFNRRNYLTKEDVILYDKLNLSKKINKLKSENEYFYNRGKGNIGNKDKSEVFLYNKLFLSGNPNLIENTNNNKNFYVNNNENNINNNYIDYNENNNFIDNNVDLFFRRKYSKNA